MTDDLREKPEMSEEKKKKIARELIEGYKKMANLNQELAEHGFIKNDGETD